MKTENRCMDILSRIQHCFSHDRVYYSQHATYEMEHDEYGLITDADVYACIMNGEIIKSYPEDKPYPSYLIFSVITGDRPIHVVCAYNPPDDLVIVITVYQPNPDLWIDYKVRRY